MTDPLTTAAQKLKEEITEHVEEVKSNPLIAEILKKKKALNALEELLGLPTTKLGQILSLDAEESAQVHVGPDEYVHLPMLDSAKAYLRKAGKPARTIEEIIEAIRRGGGVVSNEDRLKVQLVRSTGEIKKVGDGLFGLLEWYPARKGRPPGSPNRGSDRIDADDDDDGGGDGEGVGEGIGEASAPSELEPGEAKPEDVQPEDK